jgi:hypothetical protein
MHRSAFQTDHMPHAAILVHAIPVGVAGSFIERKSVERHAVEGDLYRIFLPGLLFSWGETITDMGEDPNFQTGIPDQFTGTSPIEFRHA